jgi:hypothetical protein
MVQGLAFLSKKSWHTKNIANQEKVWIEEQRKAQEDSKTKELARQIQQEREQEEIDRISGRKSHRLDRGIDWMYQGVKSEAAQEDKRKEAEDYLLGKTYAGGVKEAPPSGDFVQEQNIKEGVDAVVAGVTGAEDEKPAAFPQQEPSVADRNEAFRLRHEDPMFLVSMKRREQEEKVEKTKALYEKVVGPVDDEDSTKRRKREKKERKKERKRRREEHRRHRRRSRSRSHSRSSSYSDDDYDYHHSRRYRSRSRSPGYRRGRRSESPVRHSSRHSGDEDDARYRRHDNVHQQGQDDGRRKRLDDDHFRHNEDSQAQREWNEQYPMAIRTRLDNFGLPGSNKPVDRANLGPDRELVSKKRQERDGKRYKKPASRHKMTATEREEVLRAMKADASRHDAHRRVQQKDEPEEERKSATFLYQVARSEGQHSMPERIAGNRGRNQNITDAFL